MDDDLHQPEVLGGLALTESDLLNLHQVYKLYKQNQYWFGRGMNRSINLVKTNQSVRNKKKLEFPNKAYWSVNFLFLGGGASSQFRQLTLFTDRAGGTRLYPGWNIFPCILRNRAGGTQVGGFSLIYRYLGTELETLASFRLEIFPDTVCLGTELEALPSIQVRNFFSYILGNRTGGTPFYSGWTLFPYILGNRAGGTRLYLVGRIYPVID